jgi:8-oxo-dGTP pyrophosphatase MutT (NUDIX family)
MEDDNYCNNCGNIGHVYKNCRHPILSYGILLFHKLEEETKVIMIERKDSLSYIEFLRGKYSSIYNLPYLLLLFSRFSEGELKKINENDFDVLWDTLWIHTDTINNRIKREYSKSKEKFNKIKNGFLYKKEKINIEYLVNKVKEKKVFTMNEWEIPKGRRKQYENNKECAKREFQEETNIPFDKYVIYDNIIPLIEEYKGINGVRYKQVYYIGRINQLLELSINMENKDQYTEIKDIKWLTKKEANDSIREYDVSKKALLNKAFSFIENHENLVVIE